MTWFGQFCRDSGSYSSPINLSLQKQPLRVLFKRSLHSVENLTKDDNALKMNYVPMEGLITEYTDTGKLSLLSSS